MQARWVSHHDEFYRKYWFHDEGSGLEEALEQVYCPMQLHILMMIGKAVSRALCGHFLH